MREARSGEREVGSKKNEVGSSMPWAICILLIEYLVFMLKHIYFREEVLTIMKFKFEKLIIWQNAMDFGEEMTSLSQKFPKEELYNLSSQIRRAADSIALNISEGSICQSPAEFRKFLGYAIRSLAEVVTCLHKARKREYITAEEFTRNYDFSFNLMNMMIAFKGTITG